MKQLAQHRPGAPSGRRLERVLHLAENLRFTDTSESSPAATRNRCLAAASSFRENRCGVKLSGGSEW